jgi:hypothetical protein
MGDLSLAARRPRVMTDDSVRRLAEKIYDYSPVGSPVWKNRFVEKITPILREAMAEEFALGSVEQQKRCKNHVIQAYTRAAEVARANPCEYKCDCCNENKPETIAAAIEKLGRNSVNY